MKKLFLILSLIVFSATASAQKFTAPNLSLPFFTERNQWQVSALYHYMPEIHFTYSVHDNFRLAGVVGHGSWYKNTTAIADSNTIVGEYTYTSRRTAFQLEAAWFKKLKKRAVFDLGGGFSYGYARTSTDYNYINDSLDEFKEFKPRDAFYQVYIQPSIGFHGKHVGYGFGLKSSFLTAPTNNFSTVVLEAINEISFGWERLRFDLQLGIRLMTNNESTFPYKYVHFGGGMSYRFAQSE